MDHFIFLPVCLYLVFAGLFVQQGLTNVVLARTGLTRARGHLVYFVFASAVFCVSLLVVILSPQMGFSPEQKRASFFVCWLVAPSVGYLYVLTLADHLDISRKRIWWMLRAYQLDFATTVGGGLYTLATGNAALFSHERGEVQSLIDLHIGGVFSPNMVTKCKVAFIAIVVVASAIFFLREMLRKKRPDLSLVIGVSLTAFAIITELVGYVFQWPMIFSLMPLANAVEVVRLTYLQTIHAGQELERSRLQVRRERFHIKSHLEALSHDVRTPLTSLKIGLDRLRSDAESESESEQVAFKLTGEIEYLHVVFSNIVTLFQLELSSATLTCCDYDVRQALEAVRARFENLAAEHGIVVDISDEGEALPAHADPIALEQALGNLVYNAVIHAQEHVAISAYVDGAEVVVRVLDDGAGITEVDLPRLADRAFRHRLEAQIGCPGWGLGVAIAHALSVLQGGALSLSTDDDGFTRVEVRLARIAKTELYAETPG